MPPVPRIARAIPKGAITRPSAPIPVIARLRWASGEDTEVLAVVIGWTAAAVEIRWDMYGDLDLRSDWIDAADVRRTTQQSAGRDTRPPTSRGRSPKARW